MNVSEVTIDHKIYHCHPSGRVTPGQKICRFICIKSSILLVHFQDKLIIVAEVLLDLITASFTDIPKDVDGHDIHERDIEEPGEEKQARTEDKETGQPEADVTLGEKGLGSDREGGYSETHRVRPLQGLAY